MGKVQDWCLTICLSLFLFQASQIYCTSRINAIRRLSEVNQQEQKEKDLIKNLPGQPLVNLKQYGGYVTVDESAGRSLYYYFVENEKTDNSVPLVLWLNGGPGCSSLGFGAFKELGPFRVNSDGKTLYTNPYAWNNVANMLFLESPAGTGFSYSNTKSDLKNQDDTKTTEDSYTFLMKWLERFPEYKGREFYLTGESYAGHYVPLLAQTILQRNNNNNNNQTSINLRGIFVGNPTLDPKIAPLAEKEYLFTHGLISNETFRTYKESCQPNLITRTNYVQCHELIGTIDNATIHLNKYNIYAPLCQNSALTKEPKVYKTLLEADPCMDHYLTAYLNNAEVQSAMHVVKATEWKSCSGASDRWNDKDINERSILPVLKEFMSNPDFRVWIYSGDYDSVVPDVYTIRALAKINIGTEGVLREWKTDGEVSGYVRDTKGNHKFMTVKGAGHEVPFYTPKSALNLFTKFLRNLPVLD